MKPVEKILGRLEGVVESGSSWKALCPAHDAREPSLSVSEADGGRTLIKCFAGCEATEIIAGLGLEMGELFERRNRHRKTFTLPPENDTVGGKDIPHSYSTERSRLSLMPGKEVPDGSLA
jgi:hypothetical protein